MEKNCKKTCGYCLRQYLIFFIAVQCQRLTIQPFNEILFYIIFLELLNSSCILTKLLYLFKAQEPVAGIGAACEDKLPGCKNHSTIDGYCDYHAEFMRKNCPRSCGFCRRKSHCNCYPFFAIAITMLHNACHEAE